MHRAHDSNGRSWPRLLIVCDTDSGEMSVTELRRPRLWSQSALDWDSAATDRARWLSRVKEAGSAS